MIFSQFTTDTLFPFNNNLATFDDNLPAMWSVASTTIGLSIDMTFS
jgi:hypothetical protein